MLSKLLIGTYTNDTVKTVGTYKLYLVHPDIKTLIETAFCVANVDGSMLLSCNSTLALDLIQPRCKLDYIPPRTNLIITMQDHPKKTKQAQTSSTYIAQQVAGQSKQQAETTQIKKQQPSKLLTCKDQIMAQYPDIFQGIGKFPGPPYTIPLRSKHTTQANTLQANPYPLKGEFQEGDRKDAPSGCIYASDRIISIDKQFCLV